MYRIASTALFLPCGVVGDELRYQAAGVEGREKIVQSDTVGSGQNDTIDVTVTLVRPQTASLQPCITE